jgi:hypothetical protein
MLEIASCFVLVVSHRNGFIVLMVSEVIRKSLPSRVSDFFE